MKVGGTSVRNSVGRNNHWASEKVPGSIVRQLVKPKDRARDRLGIRLRPIPGIGAMWVFQGLNRGQDSRSILGVQEQRK